MKLSSPYRLLKDEYDVVVVGSGYGGAIAASRFARAGFSVCVLERGKEYLAKDFPDSAASAVPEAQIDGGPRHSEKAPRLPENPLGLYNVHMNDEVDVVVGCGVGGTSLINANVSIKPDFRVFSEGAWPKAIKSDVKSLEDGYARAFAMLKPNPYPAGRKGYPELPKVKALKDAGKALGRPVEYVDVNVNFDVNGKNHVGVAQSPCVNCGDCCSGCRFGAKNTLDKNYIPDALNHGAELYAQMKVSHIARQKNGGWLVYYFQQPGLPDKNKDTPSFLRASIVVLGAGALGSTEILLRSQKKGLALSTKIGEKFSGNGDVLAFVYNSEQEVRSVGFGDHAPEHSEPVGPCISAVIDGRDPKKPLKDARIIEEGVAPGALGKLLPAMFAAASKAYGEDFQTDWWNESKETAREIESLARGYRRGAINNTQICLAMSHDGEAGKITLEGGKARVSWPGYAKIKAFENVANDMRTTAKALCGTYVDNPVSQELLGNRMTTVHPLGGCPMGDDRDHGAIDHRCAVFDPNGAEKNATYDGLYVTDGAALPTAVGVNPLFTICAVAERAVAIAVRERGKKISYDFPRASREVGQKSPAGVTFTETMRGFFARWAKTYDDGFAQGKARGDAGKLEFRLTVTIDDMDEFIAGKDHLGSLTGYVTCPELSPAPLSVSEGHFNLFIDDPEDPARRLMVYRMALTAESGERYYFHGHKKVRKDEKLSVQEIWPDTSTLYVEIREQDEKGVPVARGVLRILAPDFAAQIATIAPTRLRSPKASAAALGKFGTFFFGKLWQVYAEGGRTPS